MLLGATLTLTAMRGRGELAGLAISGAGPGALRRPLLVTGVLCALTALALDEGLVPPCERLADRLYQNRRVSPLTGLQPSPSWVRLGRWFLFRQVVGGREEVLALELNRRFQVVQRVEGAGGRWKASSGQAANLDRLRRRARALWDRELVRAESLGSLELWRHLQLRGQSGQQRVAEALVLQTKLAYPLVNLAAALLAGLFCGAWRRRPAVLDLLAAVGLVLGLWLLLAGGWMLARGGWLSPAGGVWTPIILAMVAALAAQWRTSRG